jgi:transcriptional regulator with XRE-family HTH domain
MTPVTLRVRELREARGLTQGALAEKAGLRRATVNRIEMGRVKGVDLRTLELLADALEVDAAMLVKHERRRPKAGRR